MAQAPFTTTDSALTSPSNLSYSSGPAFRTASTEPSSPETNSDRTSPLLDLYSTTSTATATATTSIESAIASETHSLLDARPLEMDRNPFWSVQARRDEPAVHTTNVNGQRQFQTPQAWQTFTAAPTAASTPAAASLAPASLRGQASQASIQDSNNDNNINVHGIPLDSPGPHTMPLSPLTPTSFSHAYAQPSQPSLPQQQQGAASASAVIPTSHPGVTASFPDAQIDAVYAYCYDRGNGHYARLIPADMLPPLRDIPALQQGCAGMVVVPVPRALPLGGRSSNTEPVMVTTPPGTPRSRPDTIQSRIDTIVASTFSAPTQSLPPHSSSYPSSNLLLPSNTIPPAPAASHRQHSTQAPRRAKIYCDKWVHEGVCAFTQQGCKYKHEMPLDKATQNQLGLFHGLPLWWKRHQAELARQGQTLEEPGVTSNGVEGFGAVSGSGQGQARRWGIDRATSGGRRADAAGSMSWRRGAAVSCNDHGGRYSEPGTPADPSTASGSTSARPRPSGGGLLSCSRGPTSYGSPFGPIAPPTPRPTSHRGPLSPTRIPTSNPYASLEALEEEDPSRSARQV